MLSARSTRRSPDDECGSSGRISYGLAQESHLAKAGKIRTVISVFLRASDNVIASTHKSECAGRARSAPMTQQNCRIDLVKPENKKSFAAKSDRSKE
jgi:hypothetical protein